jgi:hypothetical protein
MFGSKTSKPIDIDVDNIIRSAFEKLFGMDQKAFEKNQEEDPRRGGPREANT